MELKDQVCDFNLSSEIAKLGIKQVWKRIEKDNPRNEGGIKKFQRFVKLHMKKKGENK